MFKWIVGRAKCLIGVHHRSHARAYRPAKDSIYLSYCEYCGVPMKRLSKRNWVVQPKSERQG
ncbi:hypothetical protein [Sphingomonas sp.]|uniref:hypothetical protein n=1 Tax=Sphingomonas sp. TaxID=28214 RepID=UPI001E031AC8|nr:hypothetical protein [Sphingomonas sp.]MBX9796106.1 hypothetical protein [Sphingomonas sp.]